MRQQRSAEMFRRNVARLRRDHGYTLKEVGKFIDVAESTVSRWESKNDGFRFPTPDALDKLCDLYRISIADLFSVEGAEKVSLRLQASLKDALYLVNQALERGELKLQNRPRD
jgi:transcriptional regulator with XRE-family HTH domain